jgi:gamma-glutamyl phosphate reductase
MNYAVSSKKLHARGKKEMERDTEVKYIMKEIKENDFRIKKKKLSHVK